MITFNSRNISAGLLIAATFSGFATSAQAVENGVTNWPNGVNTVLPAMMPPQGATQFMATPFTTRPTNSSMAMVTN